MILARPSAMRRCPTNFTGAPKSTPLLPAGNVASRRDCIQASHCPDVNRTITGLASARVGLALNVRIEVP